ncbi:MAG: SpoVG family protein [Candidatus Omnitrophica bacterium]|nr:SpoVG family protein [Candidatus Omnitrophota bacterium]
MEITEVRIFLRESEDRKLKAYATITIDNAFVVRNVKVIEGTKGLFVAMPSRKLRDACPKCNYKNAVRSKFCNQCGSALPQGERRIENNHGGDDTTRQSGHRDIAHPITPECREYIQTKVLDAYNSELKNPTKPSERYEAPKPKKDVVKTSTKPEFHKMHDNHLEDEFEGDLEL